ncbi:MAG TPA: ROK family protein [Pseudothermotoga sp.]|uniref:ROK family protein n=1 Tax=Thermotoga profunda TaxID=1508420 RepID=UPI00059784ED|nr:ROK family protein [Thermotoga profunda]
MKIAIGIDIGGTAIKGALVTENNIIEYSILELINKKKPLETLWKILDKILNENREKIEVIGIASAGRIDSNEGIILYASPNIPDWSGLYLSKMVKDRYKIPCFVINDARAAALAEARKRNVSNLVLLTIGTGLGGGIILNDQLIFGEHWEAGEIGHTILKPYGRKCNCGKKGCAEAYISMKVLHKYAKEKNRSVLIERFKKKDQNVVLAVEKMCKDLSVLIDKIFLTIDPQIVVIGGGFCELGTDALEILRKNIKFYSYRSLYNLSQIELSTLGNTAGIIGAVIHAREKLVRC